MENQNEQQIVDQLQQQVKELYSMDTAKTIDSLIEILGQLKTVATEKQSTQPEEKTQLRKDFELLKDNLNLLPKNWYYTEDKKIYPSEFPVTGCIEHVRNTYCYSLSIKKSFILGDSIHFTVDTYGCLGPFYQDFHFQEWNDLYCRGNDIAVAESDFKLPLKNFFNGMVQFLKKYKEDSFYCCWLGNAALDAMLAMQTYVNECDNDNDAWVKSFKTLLQKWYWNKLDLCTMYATGQDQKIYAWYQEVAKVTEGREIDGTYIFTNVKHPVIKRGQTKAKKAA